MSAWKMIIGSNGGMMSILLWSHFYCQHQTPIFPLPGLIPTTHGDGREENLSEQAGAGGEGGDGAAVQVVVGVGNQKIQSKTNTGEDDQNPEGTPLIPKNSSNLKSILAISTNTPTCPHTASRAGWCPHRRRRSRTELLLLNSATNYWSVART